MEKGEVSMMVKQPRDSAEEFARRGDEVYERNIRPQVDTEENKGKFVLIDIETGQWEMDADEMAASNRMDERLPNAQVWMVRVGSRYVYRIGAGRSRRFV